VTHWQAQETPPGAVRVGCLVQKVAIQSNLRQLVQLTGLSVPLLRQTLTTLFWAFILKAIPFHPLENPGSQRQELRTSRKYLTEKNHLNHCKFRSKSAVKRTDQTRHPLTALVHVTNITA